jgi:hypothetical protein
VDHPLQCRCGTVKGYVSRPGSVNRAVCYCRDCQAFAHFLGRANEILDSKGGSDIVQTTPACVTLTDGVETLACIRLTEKGLVRWYARCCSTPIGNTLADFKMSFVGLVHSCLDNAGKSLDESFGPVRMRVNTKSAKGEVHSSSLAATAGFMRILAMLMRARLNGSYKRTAFFSPETGAPVATPKVLSRGEREQLMHAVSLSLTSPQ